MKKTNIMFISQIRKSWTNETDLFRVTQQECTKVKLLMLSDTTSQYFQRLSQISWGSDYKLMRAGDISVFIELCSSMPRTGCGT